LQDEAATVRYRVYARNKKKKKKKKKKKLIGFFFCLLKLCVKLAGAKEKQLCEISSSSFFFFLCVLFLKTSFCAVLGQFVAAFLSHFERSDYGDWKSKKKMKIYVRIRID